MKNLRTPLTIISLVLIAGFNQGCGDSSKSNELNQKIETLSTKLDSVLQNQTSLQKRIESQNEAESKIQAELQEHEDAIVRRIADNDYYYSTNLLSHVNADNYRVNLALENDLKVQLDDIEKQLKPRFGVEIETLGDKVNGMKEKIDRIQRTLNQIEMDNSEIKNDTQKIKNKLGIIF